MAIVFVRAAWRERIEGSRTAPAECPIIAVWLDDGPVRVWEGFEFARRKEPLTCQAGGCGDPVSVDEADLGLIRFGLRLCKPCFIERTRR